MSAVVQTEIARRENSKIVHLKSLLHELSHLNLQTNAIQKVQYQPKHTKVKDK